MSAAIRSRGREIKQATLQLDDTRPPKPARGPKDCAALTHAVSSCKACKKFVCAGYERDRRLRRMHIEFDQVELRLDARAVLRMCDAAGATVHCRRGLIWITQLGDNRDYCLSGGDSLELHACDCTLVHSLRRSEVVVSALQETGKRPATGDTPIPGSVRRVALGLLTWIREAYGPSAVKTSRLRGWWGI